MAGEREGELHALQEQLAKLQAELGRLRQELQEKSGQEEQLRQQMTEKEEKTKKVIMGAKQKISQLNGKHGRPLAARWVYYTHWATSLSLSPLRNHPLPASATKEQFQKEAEELKQQREELEVRMSALKSQYEGRLCRQERELRELRGQQERHSEQRDEPPEQGPSKVRGGG